jgi:hypothetical protein
MTFPNLDKLVRDGWTLTISRREGYVWASVHLDARNGPVSYHHLGKNTSDAMALLNLYLDRITP